MNHSVLKREWLRLYSVGGGVLGSSALVSHWQVNPTIDLILSFHSVKCVIGTNLSIIIKLIGLHRDYDYKDYDYKDYDYKDYD